MIDVPSTAHAAAIPRVLQALDAVNTNIFPCYDFGYLCALPWYKQVVLHPYNVMYYAVSSVLFAVKKIVECAFLVIGALVKYLVYEPLNWISFGGVQRVIDRIYPLNPLLNKRQLVFPYGVERFLASVLNPRHWKNEHEMLSQWLQEACAAFKENTGVALQPPASDDSLLTDLCAWIWESIQGYGALDETEAAERHNTTEAAKQYHVSLVGDLEEMKAVAIFGNQVVVHEQLPQEIQTDVDRQQKISTRITLPGGSSIRGEWEIAENDRANWLRAVSIYPILREVVRSALRQQALSLIFLVAMKCLLAIISEKIADRIVDILTWHLSKQSELQADVVTTYCMAKIGYNPLAALYYQDFVCRKYGQDPTGEKILSFFTGRPATNDRKLAIYAAIAGIGEQRCISSFRCSHAQDLPQRSGVLQYPYSRNWASPGVLWTLDHSSR